MPASVETDIVAVQAKINVEPPIIVVVGDGGVREGALRRARELEGIAFEGELSAAVIEKEQRTGAANDKKILHAFVFKIGEERAGRGVEHADTGFFCNILECAVTAIVVEAIREPSRLAT